MKDNAVMMEYHQALLMSQANHLDSKLIKATQIQDKIKIIENNPDYISEKDIDVELKKTEEQISAALKIASEINEIKLQPNYLDRNQVQILQEQVTVYLKTKFMYVTYSICF